MSLKLKPVLNALLPVLAIFFLSACNREPKPNTDFKLSEILECTVTTTHSSDTKSFIISELLSDAPKIRHDKDGPFRSFQILHRSSVGLVLSHTADSGGTETIHLDTKNGIFARTGGGFIAGTFGYLQKGECR